jgi:alpha-L-fucosidase 2
LRTEGAFLVSAKKMNGTYEIKILSEKGGRAKLKLPFKTIAIVSKKDVQVKNIGDGFITLNCKPGGTIVIKNLLGKSRKMKFTTVNGGEK